MVYEVLSFNSDIQKSSKVFNTKHTRKYEYITYKQALENFTESHKENKNTGYFLDQKDPETKVFVNKVKERIGKDITSGVIDDVKLRGRKARAFTAWVLLKDNKGELKINESFLEGFCDQDRVKVTDVTLLTSTEEKRGIRVSLNEKKERLYKILNGEYCIKFNWEVGGKICSITMSVRSDGKVVYSNVSEGLTYQDLEKNNAVKVKIGMEEKVTLSKLYDKAKNQRQPQTDLSSGVSTEQVTAELTK